MTRPLIPAFNQPRCTDPMERWIEEALLAAGIQFLTDQGGGNPSGLDFVLPDLGVEIEVKRFHTPRAADQLARAPNVILAQGEGAVEFLARAIRALAVESPSQHDGEIKSIWGSRPMIAANLALEL